MTLGDRRQQGDAIRVGRAIPTILLCVTLLTAGASYPAPEASAHLAKKERYLEEHGQIATAEDFIAKAATKSSMTGKPYTVRCGSEPAIASDEWLLAELRRSRQGR